MISFTEAQILAWVTPILWPFLRVLALFTALPVMGQRTVPARLRIALAFLVALCAQAALPPQAVAIGVPLDSAVALMLTAQQVFIGLALGFAVRVVFAAVEFAGELVGLQMGLNFAGFFDPATATQTTASARFFSTLVGWLFVVINGHLLVMMAIVESFKVFPASPEPLEFLHRIEPLVWGGELLRLGLWIALPLVTMLLFVNLVLGLISRVAAQINIFAVGFPITLGVGLLGLLLTLPMMQAPFEHALQLMLQRFSG
jgi:flagellar biosynthetic protein FliR